MTFTPSRNDYTNAYANKVKNTAERGIEFKIDEQTYIQLLMSRHLMTCMYTGRKFVMDKGSNHPDYPEMDRVDPNRGYEIGNIVFVGRHAHGLKTKYIELERSSKGISHKDAQTLRQIEKTLGMPTVLEGRKAIILDIADKVAAHQVEEQQRKEKQVASEEEARILEQERNRKEHFKNQNDIAAGFTKFFTMFDRLGATFELTIKEFRDKFRRNTCAVTGIEFDSYEDKWLWVIDLTLPITASNIVVCKKEVSESLDHVRKLGGQEAVIKLINKKEF